MQFIDSHCHLDFPEFKEDFSEIISRSEDANVILMQLISTKPNKFAEIISLAQQHDKFLCSIGIHPLELKNHRKYLASELIAIANHEKVIGIGETGLDYYYDKDHMSLQQESFIEHIKAARELNLPLIVHTRDADEDTINILREQKRIGDFSAVLHCFTATRELALAAIEEGFYISASGIITFKNAVSIQEIFKEVPLNRILIETDAPYLAPVPKRGKRNEPAFVVHTAEYLANLRGESLEAIGDITTENFFRLFKKAQDYAADRCIICTST